MNKENLIENKKDLNEMQFGLANQLDESGANKEIEFKEAFGNNYTAAIGIILATRISDTNIPTRIKNVLILWGNINTVYDLVKTKRNEFLTFRNCGLKTIGVLEDFVKEQGLYWL